MNSDPKSIFSPIKSSSSIILSRAKQAYNREGLLYVLRSALIMILGYFIVYYYKKFKSSETFEFQGKTYAYFFHPYGTTWRNERIVAVPIIWDIVKAYEERKKNILEVGNMLSYYFKVSHDILDKYEIRDGVINQDVVDFKTSKKYDLIVSILTLPEVGWYESPRNPEKSLRSLDNLKKHLSPDGQIVLVVGLGLNTQFEMSLRSKTLELSKPGYLIHTKGYRWKEANWQEAKNIEYDKKVPTAHAILIGTIELENVTG